MQLIQKYRQSFLDQWFSVDSKLFFLIVCLLYFTSFFLKRLFVYDEIAAFEVLQERGEMWIMELFFGLEYLVVPIYLAWKFTLTAFIIWVGSFMFGYKLTFSELWKMVMIMELVFIIPELGKVLWFLVSAGDPNYHDVVAFYPLSLINLFDYESLNTRWIYPLKAINVFEAVYWFFLMTGIFWLSNKKWKISVFIVLSSYGLFFFLWLIYYLLAYR